MRGALLARVEGGPAVCAGIIHAGQMAVELRDTRNGPEEIGSVKPARPRILVEDELPRQRAVSIHRIYIVVARADVDRAVRSDRRRRAHDSPGCKLPLERPVGIHCIEAIVVATQIDRTVGADGWRRVRNVAAQGEFPLQRPVGVDCVEVPVPRIEVDRAIGSDRRGRRHDAGGGELPLERASRSDCVEVPIPRADIVKRCVCEMIVQACSCGSVSVCEALGSTVI